MNKKRNIVIAFNCIIPLLTGAMFYYLFSPEVWFVKSIDEIIGRKIRFYFVLENSWALSFIRYYILDMLWAYSLIFALFFSVGDNNTANRKKVFVIAFLFSAIMEILQLTPLVKGTFDLLDIKITATRLEDGLFGTQLKLLIENNSAKSITVQARKANVNGFMVSTMMSVDVASGKKANDSLTFETSGLKDCGIKEIATMEFSFHIMDTETWEDIVDTETIVINTSIASAYTQEVDDSGEVLVESNGIKIVGKGLSADDSFWGPGVVLYIENNSDRDVTIQTRDVSVNGFMVEAGMSEDVVAGKKAMSAVQFFATDLEENAITDITDVELYFHIYDIESWDTIFDSDVIAVSF